jgi:hypothetical protein
VSVIAEALREQFIRNEQTYLLNGLLVINVLLPDALCFNAPVFLLEIKRVVAKDAIFSIYLKD